MKVTVRLTWLLSTTTRSQVSHGGLERDAEQLVPEQFTVVGPCCRDSEPSLRSSEQFLPSAASRDQQSVTERASDEANSGTYNLTHKQLRSKQLLLSKTAVYGSKR